MSIFRRRLMMGEKKPIEYLEFEDRRVWEICAYRWGDTYNLQEVNGAGGVLGSGELEGNGDTLVYSDYMFAATYAISAHGSVPATAARTVQYRVELIVDGGRALDGENAPWDIATASATTNQVFYPVQYNSLMSTTALGTITAENWTDPTFWASQTILTDGGAVGANAHKYTALITATNACQYLRLGIRAVAGTNISWKFVSVGVTKLPQGITQAQCAAVSTIFTNVFQKNNLISRFHEFQNFTGVTQLNQTFGSSTLTEITFPPSITLMDTSVFRGSQITVLNLNEGLITYCKQYTLYDCNYIEKVVIPSTVTVMGSRGAYRCRALKDFIMLPTTPPTITPSNYWNDHNSALAIYVPDESLGAYKADASWSPWASLIKPLSEYVN